MHDVMAGAVWRVPQLYMQAPYTRVSKDPGHLQDAASRIDDKALKTLLPVGVGFHHAALSGGDRSIVEQLFIAGDLLVGMAERTAEALSHARRRFLDSCSGCAAASAPYLCARRAQVLLESTALRVARTTML